RGLIRPALPAEQQRLGQGDVVAALHPDPRPQQRGVDTGGRGPDPPDAAGPLEPGYRGRKIIMPNDGSVAGALLRHLRRAAPGPRPGADGDPPGSDSRLPG